ncbi:MAG: hypothetical protein VX784_15010 [Pseudomonadota bacterium]|nr:hypothetical protein [Pseudomonadota bacterium]
MSMGGLNIDFLSLEIWPLIAAVLIVVLCIFFKNALASLGTNFGNWLSSFLPRKAEDEPTALSPGSSISELAIEGLLARRYGLTVNQFLKQSDQFERMQADLSAMRAQYPDWAAEIDKAVQGVNEARPEDTDLALSHIEALTAHRPNAQTQELRLAEAVAKHTRAVLVYPYDYA